MSSCVKALCVTTTRISQRKLLNNVYCFVVVFCLQFKQLQRVVTMALKSLYRVCEIKKLDLIFSSFSVRSQNHSYKNSIVFRLARHLCSSTSLVLPSYQARLPFVLKHTTSLFVYLDVRMSFCTLTFSYFCVSSLFDPVPNFTKWNPPV